MKITKDDYGCWKIRYFATESVEECLVCQKHVQIVNIIRPI
jgi:hypothetical protein